MVDRLGAALFSRRDEDGREFGELKICEGDDKENERTFDEEEKDEEEDKLFDKLSLKSKGVIRLLEEDRE